MTEGKTFFGHPRGLSTLFFTEMWERFSYYGMRALLMLFMVDSAFGGMGMNDKTAGAIYGLYTFGVYAMALPGGWVADRLVGQKKAVLYGGILIALGHYSMALPVTVTFYLGLGLIILGTGLLKPNVSAIVGDLYHGDTGGKRDAGFSIFYMGINLGAFVGPLICGWVGQPNAQQMWRSWHYGFGAAGVGMTLALVQYVIGGKYLRGAGELKEEFARPEKVREAWGRFIKVFSGLVLAIAAFTLLVRSGVLRFSILSFAQATGMVLVGLAVAYFTYIIGYQCKNRVERLRVGVCAILFLGAAMFWSGFEQAGSSMNLFTDRYTEMMFHGYRLSSSWFQSLNPIYIILFAPVIGLLWVKLASRNPSIPVKFGAGLVLLAVGFLVLAWGSVYVRTDDKGEVLQRVNPSWLVVTYFFHTIGELCLSPVGLSSITKLSPKRLVGQMMGTWFLGAALGNLIAGLLAGYLEELSGASLFGAVAAIVGVSGILFVILSKPIRWMCQGVN